MQETIDLLFKEFIVTLILFTVLRSIVHLYNDDIINYYNNIQDCKVKEIVQFSLYLLSSFLIFSFIYVLVTGILTLILYLL